jgi:hypothetical protein
MGRPSPCRAAAERVLLMALRGRQEQPRFTGTWEWRGILMWCSGDCRCRVPQALPG